MTGKMETPFYHDDSVPNFGQIPDYDRYQGHKIMSKKNSMPHNFSNGMGNASSLKHNSPSGLGMMSSPDMNLLKLSSPDLEHLIIQSNQGLVTTSPAPNASANPFMYRNHATNEQEGFADGFVQALADLHKQNQLVGAPMSPSASMQGPYQRNLMQSTDMPMYTNLSSYNPNQLPTSYPGGGQMAYASPRGPDAPQTVPEVPHLPGASSPLSLSPIDLESQERIKAERKKLRNRIAASKCRKRKLERISRLEDKVKVLKTQNSDLASTASILREQVAQLKQKVMNHVTNGCQIAVGSAKSGESASC